MPLARELCVVFTAGVVTEPPAQFEVDILNSSTPKKLGVDIKERRKLAKRIIKAIQPQLETALRAEADISGINFEKELAKLEHLWETCLEAEVGPPKDAEGDITMAEGKHNGVARSNGKLVPYNIASTNNPSTEHEDGDEDREEHGDIIVDVSTGPPADAEDDGDTITTAALTEVNGNKPPAKVNGLKGVDADDHPLSSENGHLDSTTPPEPIINDNPATDNTLAEGGVPQFLSGYFSIEGTDITEIEREETRASEELSEMDDEEVNKLLADTEMETLVEAPPPPPVVPAPKPKKAKSKRRR